MILSVELLSSVGPTSQREHVWNQSRGCETIMRTTNAILVVILSADTSTTKDHEQNPRNVDTTEETNTNERSNTTGNERNAKIQGSVFTVVGS